MSEPTRRKTLTVAEVLSLPPLFPVWPTLGQILDTGKTATYEMARSDTAPVPVIKVGRLLRCRKVDVLAFLGLTENGDGTRGATRVPLAERTPESTSE